MSDRFDIDAGLGLNPEDFEAIAPIATQIRDNAISIIHTVFGRESDTANVNISPISGADVETALVGDYLVIEMNLQSGRGDAWPCLTFVQPEEISAAFDLGDPGDGNDWSAQVERLDNAAELLVEALNAQLETLGPTQLSFSRPTVRGVSLPDDAASLLLAPDEQFLEVSYQLVVADIGDLAVVTIAAQELIQHLISDATGQPVGARSGPTGTASFPMGGLADDILANVGDPFAAPTGRTPADILDDLPSLGGTPLGGSGMSAGPSAGPSPGQSQGLSARDDSGIVRPAQFQQFGNSAEQGTIANIDLIMDVGLRITVELGRTSKSIREVLEMGAGTVIELDKLAGEPVDILVNDKPIARGEVVVVDENFGVRVTEIASPAKRVASLR